MTNMILRAIWGTIFITVIIGSFLINDIVVGVVLTLFMVKGILEFYRFFNSFDDSKPNTTIGLIGAILLFAVITLPECLTFDFNVYALIIPLAFLPFLNIVFSAERNPLVDIAITLFSWIYIVLPFYFIFKIYKLGILEEYPWVFALGFFGLVWTNDTFAYLTGLLIGRHKLIERVSPKKTWEGAIGGFLFTIVFGVVYAQFMERDLTFWILAAIVVSPAAIFGDLIESRIKRIVGVKDSGSIIPGHGGVLDRFDATIYAAPFFYTLCILFL